MLELTDYLLFFLRLELIRLTHKIKTVVAEMEMETETEMDNIKTNSKMEEDKIQNVKFNKIWKKMKIMIKT